MIASFSRMKVYMGGIMRVKTSKKYLVLIH